MKFVEAIHLALQQSTTVITAVGSSAKIFQSFAAPTTSAPFIVVGSQSDEALNPTIKGTGDTVRLATLTVDCVSSSLSQATNIADHVRVDLYNSAGSLATASNSPMVIQNIRIDGSNMAYDMGSEGTEYGVFVCSVTVKIWYVASTPAPITLVTNPSPPAP